MLKVGISLKGAIMLFYFLLNLLQSLHYKHFTIELQQLARNKRLLLKGKRSEFTVHFLLCSHNYNEMNILPFSCSYGDFF